MAASPRPDPATTGTDTTFRRRRYQPSTSVDHLPTALTARSMQLLRLVADYRVASLPQLARLEERSRESTRRQMRALFDTGLVRVVAVPRAALAAVFDANDPSLLFGSAPNIYTMTPSGMRLLDRFGCIVEDYDPPVYGPRNCLFLAHELAIRDCRVWLELSARSMEGHTLERWRDGGAAEINLVRSAPPKTVRPDAWFVYRLGEKVLVGMIEVDRATERLVQGGRWQRKLDAYGALYQSDVLLSTTGYRNARVIVTVPTERRRESLAEHIGASAPTDLAARFWIGTVDALSQSVAQATWRRPLVVELCPLCTVEESRVA